MKRICSICARGGSKGVPGKNKRLLAGLPLIAHSILQAKRSGLFDIIAVSSDDPEILKIALEYGAHYAFERSEELSSDKAPKIPVIRDCVEKAERELQTRFDICTDLDCTSPLRSIEDIKNCVTLAEKEDTEIVITAAPARRSPYFNMVETDGVKVTLSKVLPNNIVRRQDAPSCYDMNASIYVWKREALENYDTLFQEGTRLVVMPEERSQDIDSELDFKIVELLMEHR